MTLAEINIQVPLHDIEQALPLLWMTGLGIFVVTLDLLLRSRKAKSFLGWVSILGVILGLLFNQFTVEYGENAVIFYDAFQVDAFTYYANVVILMSVLLSLLSSIEFLRRSDLLQGEFYGLLLLGTSGMMMMAGANNLVIFFLGFEIMSLTAYILVGWARSDVLSGEGSLKYVVTGAFTSAIMVYGIALLFASSGSFSFDALHETKPLFVTGLALIIGSFAFKVAAVPFHMWAPDAYRGAPTPVTGFISTGVKVAAFMGFLRVLYEMMVPTWGWTGLRSKLVVVLAVLAAVTVLVGNIAAIAYRNIKGMLAYSSIAHAGYLMIGVSCLFTESGDQTTAMGAVLFYLLVYTFMNLGAFGCVIYASNGEEQRLQLSDYKGLFYEHPWLSCAFGLFLISLTGIPLTAGFTGKVIIFREAIQSGLLWLALVGAAGTLISLYYYLRVIVMMFMHEPQEPSNIQFSASLTIMLTLAAYGVLYLGVSPGRIMDLANTIIS